MGDESGSVISLGAVTDGQPKSRRCNSLSAGRTCVA